METRPRVVRRESHSPTDPTRDPASNTPDRREASATEPTRERAEAAGRAAGADRPSRRRAKAVRSRTPEPHEPTRHDPRLGRIIDLLGEQLGPQRVERYLNGHIRLSIEGCTLVVDAETEFIARLAANRFGSVMRLAVDEVLGPGSGLRFAVADLGAAGTAAPAEPSHGPQRASRRHAWTGSDERRDLSRFVVGASNRLAHDAALRMISTDASARPFSRLLVHGPCGNGKTHLLAGIARRLREQQPQARVRFVAAEAFTNDYIQAIQSGRSEAFRRKHRALDLLCLDDVHFVARKKGTQTELLHTLDAIEAGGARLVLASDAHPHRIKDLNAALTSRFVAGMVLEISNPDEMLCLDLVRHFARERRINLQPDAADLLVSNARRRNASARDIEGMLVRLAGALHAEKLEGASVSADLVRTLSRQAGSASPASRSARFEDVAGVVLEHCRVPFEELGKPGRQARVVLARGLITELCKRLTGMSYPEISRAIGKRNHSTVITARQRLAGMMEERMSYGLPSDGMSHAEACDMLERAVAGRL